MKPCMTPSFFGLAENWCSDVVFGVSCGIVANEVQFYRGVVTNFCFRWKVE